MRTCRVFSNRFAVAAVTLIFTSTVEGTLPGVYGHADLDRVHFRPEEWNKRQDSDRMGGEQRPTPFIAVTNIKRGFIEA